MDFLETERSAAEIATERLSARRVWRFAAHDTAAVQALADRCGISPVVARLLLQREITTGEAVEAFLKPKLSDLRSPALLPGMEAATQRILSSVAAGEPIVVYGDYDADGMTATSILYLCLKNLGASVVYHL
ncbi:MAG: hypothetical protein ACTHOU_17440, partial [Aureliella sp.]